MGLALNRKWLEILEMLPSRSNLFVTYEVNGLIMQTSCPWWFYRNILKNLNIFVEFLFQLVLKCPQYFFSLLNSRVGAVCVWGGVCVRVCVSVWRCVHVCQCVCGYRGWVARGRSILLKLINVSIYLYIYIPMDVHVCVDWCGVYTCM